MSCALSGLAQPSIRTPAVASVLKPRNVRRSSSVMACSSFEGDGESGRIVTWQKPSAQWGEGRAQDVLSGVLLRRPLLDEGASIELVERELKFRARIHHDRAVPGDRLFDRLA